VIPRPPHVDWLVATGTKLATSDGLHVPIWELNYDFAHPTFEAWATHFRQNYCADDKIDSYRSGTHLSRAEYLLQLRFPHATDAGGPSIRSGDFAEILIADYLEWHLNLEVPRMRWNAKMIPNESSKGSDVLGFRFEPNGIIDEDQLTVFEVKASLSARKNSGQFASAVDHSGKDELRLATSLNYLKQRYVDANDIGQSAKIARFQSFVDSPYVRTFGAAAVYSDDAFDDTQVTDVVAASHPHYANLEALLITGSNLMEVAHHLYTRAANGTW
jgi:hypothetical protein